MGFHRTARSVGWTSALIVIWSSIGRVDDMSAWVDETRYILEVWTMQQFV
jgi:hypothetical protein